MPILSPEFYKKIGKEYEEKVKHFYTFKEKVKNIAESGTYPSLSFDDETDNENGNTFWISWLGKRYLICFEFRATFDKPGYAIFYPIAYSDLEGKAYARNNQTIEVDNRGNARRFRGRQGLSYDWRVQEDSETLLCILLGEIS